MKWTGPDPPKDFVTIVKKGTPERQYKRYFYTAGNPGKLRAPDEPGGYEVRYLTGQKYYTLASAAIVVTANLGIAASLFPARSRCSHRDPVERAEQSARLHHDRPSGDSGSQVRRLCLC